MDTIQPAEIKSTPFTHLEQPSSKPSKKFVIYDISGMVQATGVSFSCLACYKKFSTKASLKRHHERFPVCERLIQDRNLVENQMQENTQVESLDNFVSRLVQESYYDTPFVCRYCEEQFTNRGNLNRHFTYSVACSRLAMIRFDELWARDKENNLTNHIVE